MITKGTMILPKKIVGYLLLAEVASSIFNIQLPFISNIPYLNNILILIAVYFLVISGRQN